MGSRGDWGSWILTDGGLEEEIVYRSSNLNVKMKINVRYLYQGKLKLEQAREIDRG